MASTRFPGKPLVDLMGKPMVQWVVEAALVSHITDRIIVATPDQEIIDACDSFGAEAIRTRLDHQSGTDRIAEVSETLAAEILVNVQGDEPLVDPETIRACAEPLLRNPQVRMGSVWTPCSDEELENPACVKVVTSLQGDALYFSRYPVPFPRNNRPEAVKKHIGIYAYRREVVQAFATWAQTPLELAEGLEQLRFMENGVAIRMTQGTSSPVAVDTPEQADEVRRILEGRPTH
jgi:3-deoxy-manno-octulosonate cytidylyltransferase (CMP-KDO synthetase)